MLLRRFYHDSLAQASYLVGCQQAGTAIIVDPNRAVDDYLAAAEAERVRITHVTETHIHADFVSGSRELANSTGARLLLSGEGGTDWAYRFADADGAQLLHHGDTIQIGRVRLGVVHTPGHTPEHLTFLVTDGAASDKPMGAFTGDFIFVGDVGRPDLLERAANQTGTMEESARTLYRSLRAFAANPDYLQIWPGHGAGSACGKALGAVPQSTLGYERIANWAFAASSEQQFVDEVLSGQPVPPRYFAVMKRVNRDGPPIIGEHVPPSRLGSGRLTTLARDGVMLIDLRQGPDFIAQRVRGAINIPLNRGFITWAGQLLPYDRPIYLVAGDENGRDARHALAELRLIGLDDVRGWFGPEVVSELGSPATIRQLTPSGLRERLDANGLVVLDVRNDDEWESGHFDHAIHIPLASLSSRMQELDRNASTVVHCQSGARSVIAVSMLEAAGFSDVSNLVGGMNAWSQWKDQRTAGQ